MSMLQILRSVKQKKESMAYDRDLQTAASYSCKRELSSELGQLAKRGRWSGSRGRGGAIGNGVDKPGRACLIFSCDEQLK